MSKRLSPTRTEAELPGAQPSSLSAAEFAAEQVARVRDDPGARLALLASLYEAPGSRPESWRPYRRAAAAFMEWQLERQLLNPLLPTGGGSPWWRAVNESLLRVTCEARELALGRGGSLATGSVESCLHFIRSPSAKSWYRAHNAAIVAGYLAHRKLAGQETRGERFFINLVLLRMLYAHALVAAPRLALGWLSPLAPMLGDPRFVMTRIFLSLSRVLPDRYPIGDDVQRYARSENGFAKVLDVGVIRPRLLQLYDWSAEELGIPALRGLLHDGVPAYAWDPEDSEPWNPKPSWLARWALRVLPVR
jgi:hypothetical protein